MMRMHLSRAGAALIREMRLRAGAPADSIRLVAYRATEWRSMTFEGERHEIGLRLIGSAGAEALARLLDDLGEQEFDLGGDFVADIGATHTPADTEGAVEVTIEALTISA